MDNGEPSLRAVGACVARLQAADAAAVFFGRDRVRRKSVQSNRRNGTTFQLLGAGQSAEEILVTQIFTSWNPLTSCYAKSSAFGMA
jgi:hypothetical protein